MENQHLSPQNDSDDEMIDIQIEESLVRESLMAIDTSNFKEDVYNLLGFAVILGLMMMIGFFGPPATLSQTVSQYFNDNFYIQFFSEELSPKFRFVDYILTLTRDNASAKTHQKFWASFQYTVESYKNDVILHRSSDKINELSFEFLPGETKSKHIHVYRDRIIDYSRIEFTIKVLHSKDIPEEGINATAKVRFGDPSFTLFQKVARLFFSIFVLSSLGIFLKKLSKTKFKLWHLEQKLTVPLLALGVLYNNPLYIIQADYPTYVYILYDTIVVSLFSAYFKFFILVLFDSLRYKNRKTGNCFLPPKIIFIIILFLSSVIHGIYDDITSFHDMPNHMYDQIENGLKWTEIILTFIYLIWAGITVFLAGLQIDITERYKFFMYLITGGTSLLVLCIVNVIFPIFDVLRNSSIHFMMRFSVDNAFISMMMFFHLPYEVISDQDYASDSDRNDAVAVEPNEFFEDQHIANEPTN